MAVRDATESSGGSYTTADDDILNGSLYALSASDGSEQWEFKSDAITRTSDGTTYRRISSVYSPPTIADDTVYIAANAGDEGGYVYGVNAADGTERWSFRSERGEAEGSLAAADGTIYVPVGQKIIALSTTDGTER
jgi:outer membrane protein assembly factor BamB